MSPVDIYGNRLNRNLAKEPNGLWGVNVWKSGLNGLICEPPLRYFYITRKEARSAHYSDPIGRNGRAL